MKTLSVIFAGLLFLCSPVLAAKDKEEQTPEPQPTVATQPGQLNPETMVKLVVIGNYKSGNAKKGSRVNLRVDEDVVDVNGAVLIRKGTPAYGTVTQSRRSGIFGKRGLLNISVDYTSAVDSQRIPLRATKDRAGKSNSGATIAATVLLAPVALFIKGGNVTLKEGTEIIAYVDDIISVKLNGAAK